MRPFITAVFEKSLQAGMGAAEDFVHVFQTFADFQRRQLPPASTHCSSLPFKRTVDLTPSPSPAYLLHVTGEIKGNTEQSEAKGAPIRHTLQRAVDTLTTCAYLL
jgi:hypothetical protein